MNALRLSDPEPVPFVGSNAFIARACARIAQAFARECRLRGRERMVVVDLHGTPGLFAAQFLRVFDPAEGLRVTYVMADTSQEKLDAARAHPALAPFVAGGMLELVRFDPERDDHLTLGDVTLSEREPVPVMAIANRAFDGLRQDSYRCFEGRLFQQLVEVRREPARIGVTSHEVGPGEHYARRRWNAVLERHRAELGDATFTFPVAALRSLETLWRISGELLVVSAGPGAATPGAIRSCDGLTASRRAPVNYWAMAEVVREQNGEAQLFEQRDLVLGAFQLGARGALTSRACAAELGQSLAPGAMRTPEAR